ncbi:VTT domain-containing protein [Candidatus Micrarchaeota archaeon]|nr:VTT domain-containing protein [Candidatus Micrarchaeota archaeon]
MEKKLEGIVEIVFAIAIGAAVLYFTKDIAALGAYGYLGAFLIAALSSATILFPAPGWAIVIAMSATLDPVLLGVVAGAGSAIGELTGYIAGDGVRDLMNSRIKETKKIQEFVEKFGMAGIFALAFLPNPLFDIAGVIAGGLKIPWWRYLISCAAGRVLRYILLALLGSFTLALLS